MYARRSIYSYHDSLRIELGSDMKLVTLLVLALLTANASSEELPIRIEYITPNVPIALIFRMMVTDSVERTEGDDERIRWTLWQLNRVQLPNGGPEPTREEAEELVQYFEALIEQASARLNEMWRVLACPHDRARPTGDDIYLVLEVIQDAQDSMWEQLRQQAVKERPLIAELTDEYSSSMSMNSRRYHLKEAWASRGRDDPDQELDEICLKRQM